LLIFFLISTLLFSFAKAEGGVPSTLSYQGRLTDSTGNLLGNTGTPYFFKFSFWDNPVVGSGSKVWPLSNPSPVSLVVKQGVFNVNIGDIDSGYPDILDYNFNTNKKLYLQVEVSPNNSSFETLSPRQKITSSAFAEVSGQVSGIGQSSFGTTTSVSNSIVTVQSTSSNSTAMTLLASEGQNANIFDIFDSNNNSIFSINKTGGLLANFATTTNFFSNFLRSTDSIFDNSSTTNLFASNFRLSNLNGLLFGNDGAVSSMSTTSLLADYYNKKQSDNLYDLSGSASSSIASHESLYNHNLIATALQSESDPLFMAASSSLPYQPIGQYLTAESDPIWTSEKINYLTATGSGALLSGITKTQIGLGNVPNLSFSGLNTGDETQSSIKTKLGSASAGVDGYLNGNDWNTFNNKLSSFTETDPLYIASSWSTTTNNSTNWNTAYGWGNHTGLYDLVGSASSSIASHENLYNHNLIATALQSESDPLFMAASSSLNYVKTETDPIWNSASSSLTVNNFSSPNISQWNNNSGYLTSSALTPYSTKTEADLLYKPIGYSPDLSAYSTTLQANALYLAIGATATNSSELEGHNATYFQVAGNYLTNETDPAFTSWLSTTPPLYSFTETDPLSLHLNQTSPQTFTAGDVVGTGLLKVTNGVLGLDQTAYVSGTPWAGLGYLTAVTASSPLSGAGTVASPLIFTNPGYITSSALTPYSTTVQADSLYYPLSSNPSGYLTSLSGSWLSNGNTNGSKKTLGSIDNYDIGLITNNTERMTILSNGNVGIGTNSPSNKLSVAGNVDISGDVGIGTTPGAYQLQVGGNGIQTSYLITN